VCARAHARPVDIVGGVAIGTLDAGGGRVAHGNEARRDVGQVEVEAAGGV
jgi:hypothetical protein